MNSKCSGLGGRRSAFLLPLVLGPAYGVEAVCEVYMSDAQAAAAIFPGRAFSKKSFALSKDQVREIEKASDETVRWPDVTRLVAQSGEVVYIDRVLGKHEFITYAIGIDGKGKVKGIEILEYRESYGREVRRESWRAQFKDKDLSSPLKPDQDVKSISGATLSSVHITRGVKRVLHTHGLIAKNL